MKMPWCPSCGYEYRPEVQRCASCDVALVAEPPTDAPRVAGLQVETVTPRYLSRFAGLRAGFAAGIQLARTAAQMTLRQKKLLLIIALLVSFWFVGSLAPCGGFAVKVRKSDSGMQLATMPVDSGSLLERWWKQVHFSIPLRYLLQDFHGPLDNVAGFLNSWIGLPFLVLVAAKNSQVVLDPYQYNALQSFLQSLLWLGYSLLAGAVAAAVLAGLLGWLRAIITGTPRRPWRAYLTDHYWPLFTLSLCVTLGIRLPMFPPEITQLLVSGPVDWRNTLNDFTHFISHDVFSSWIMPLALLALTLAPFAIVARNLGAWGGVKAGVRILWQNKWVSLGLFVVYRVIREVIQLISLWRSYGIATLDQPSIHSQVALWAITLAQAFLGLWLAMAFTLLVAAEKPLEQAAESAG